MRQGERLSRVAYKIKCRNPGIVHSGVVGGLSTVGGGVVRGFIRARRFGRLVRGRVYVAGGVYSMVMRTYFWVPMPSCSA